MVQKICLVAPKPKLFGLTQLILTFNEVFMRTAPYTSDRDSQLCTVHLGHGSALVLDPDLERWLSKDENNCEEGTAFCWMGCLPLPKECIPKEKRET